MIPHRPHGSGHPYLADPDQRTPRHPAAGDHITIRAVTHPDVEHLDVEVDADGDLTDVPAAPAEPDRPDGISGGGHLADAATSTGNLDEAACWQATIGPYDAGTTVRYRLADGARTGEWHAFTVAGWHPDGATLHATVTGSDPDGQVADRLDRAATRWLIDDAGPVRVRFALNLHPDEHIVGLGERFHALDQRGWSIDNVVFEQYTNQHTRTYLPVPFAIVVGGPDGPWGLHVATSRRCWYDIAAADPDRLIIEADVDPERPDLDLHLYAGQPADILDAFYDDTARPERAPDWVFRPWMSGNEWNTQQRVEREVQRSLDEDIPVGVIVIEAWSDEATFTAFRDAEYTPNPDGAPHTLDDFTFPADGPWPDPRAMIDRLHDHDIQVLLWQIPLLPADVDNPQLVHDRRALVDNGYAVLEADGTPYTNRGWWFPRALLPDFTDPDAAAWWTAKRRYLLEDLEVDGFKTDGGEHPWGHDLRYADGTRGADTNNRYPALYADAYHQLLDDTDTHGITFSRAGYTGSAATPCHWAGDQQSTWDEYRAAITAGLTAATSGIIFWGFDLAGFSGDIPDAELYLRATATACFTPIMQYHSEYNHHRTPSNDRTPWNIAERTGHPDVIPIYRRYAKLRDRLVPYLSRHADRAVEHGTPLMRPLLFDHPDDQNIWDHPYQYKLGDDLLIAPVTQPHIETRTVYLPEGTWTDLNHRTQHAGPTTVDVPTPLDVIPAFARLGAVEELLEAFEPHL